MGHRVTDLLSEPPPRGGRRREKSTGTRGCLAALLALVVVVGGLVFVGNRAFDFLGDLFSESASADYPGPGQGTVTVTVEEGSTGSQIAETLEEAGVVADAATFAEVVASDPKGDSIQAGAYEMRKEMSSEEALQLLLEGNSRVTYAVTIPEGLTVEEILDLIAKETQISRDALAKAAKNPTALELPAYAEGDIEGYLFPAQYEMPPETTATEALKMMVDRFRQVVEDGDIEQRASDLGVEPHDLVTIASLVQAEAPAGSFDKVARVVYNREEEGMALQFDSTVHYAIGDTGGDVFTTPEEREFDSPYNTYLYPGLPPGAIGAPGEDALEAALTPAEGDWLYFVTVNLETGKTLFAETLDEHNNNVNKLEEYCRTAEC
jgi:UPF0755 protein